MITAPRIYLDTADLIAIGDDKEDATVVMDLFHQCKRLAAILVVSVWHVADARNAPRDAKQRIIDAIDRFPHCALAGLADDGIMLCPVPSLEALLNEHAADVQTLEQQVNDAVRLYQSAPKPEGLPTWLLNLSNRLMIELIQKATTEEEAVSIGRSFLAKHRRRIPPENAERMLQGIVAYAWPLRVQLEQAGLDVQLAVEGLRNREVTEVPGGHIGRHVGVLVNQRRQKQADRAVQRGDLADRNHVQFAPYMDIFTGDHDICTWLREWRTALAFERPVQAVTSRHLNHVVRLLEQR